MKNKILLAVLLLLTCTAYAEDAKQLAKVDNYSGIYVFSESEPVAEYETLGDVSVSSGESSIYSIGGLTFVSGGTLQYSELRNSLIVAAVMANRQVEGVIIRPEKAGCGRATMIKFKDGTPKSERELAYVNSHRNVLVFIDCKPVSDYEFHAKYKYHGWDGRFSKMIDNLVQNTRNLSKASNAVIIHFITNGYDYAEAITIKED